VKLAHAAISRLLVSGSVDTRKWASEEDCRAVEIFHVPLFLGSHSNENDRFGMNRRSRMIGSVSTRGCLPVVVSETRNSAKSPATQFIDLFPVAALEQDQPGRMRFFLSLYC